MATLSNTEIGSIVYNLTENIPTGISGLLVNGFLVDQAVYQAQNFTGDTISTSAIEDKYQPAIISLTISQTLGQMEAQGIGTKAVKIGELSIEKGMGMEVAKNYEKLGYNQLNDLGRKTSYYQTWC